MRSREVWLAVLVLSFLALLVAGVASADGGRYVWKETVKVDPGDRVKDLVLANGGYLRDALLVTSHSGSDFFGHIVETSDAASDTAGVDYVRFAGAGEMVPCTPVFFVRPSAATDTLYVRLYQWVE